MKKRLLWCLTVSVALLMSTSNLVFAKSEARSDGFTKSDKEFYLSEELLSFIRPGVEFELVDFVIPEDNQPLATFTLKDPGGLPLDREGIFTPGPVDVRMMLTYIPPGEENKISYHDRLRDRDGEYTQLGPGSYTYKFTTVLPDDWDMDASHTLAVVATRDLREFDLGRYYDNDVMNYIPSGEGELFVRDITTTATCNRCHDPLGEHGGRYQDVQVCQQCHNPGLVNDENGLSYTLSAVTHRVHSSNEPETGEIHYPVLPDDQWWDCEVCHTGGTPTADYPIVTNPNPAPTCDGRGGGMTTVSWMADDPALVRIGSAEGKIFASSGGSGSQETGNWVTDGMSFVLVDTDTGTMMDSTEAMLSVFGCAGNAPGAFAGEAGAVHTHWLTRPSRVACAGCHVDVDFEGGTNHPAQSDDDGCGLCHAPTGDEFDLSVQGAHTIPYKSTALAGVLVTIKEVRGGMAGQSPMVIFSLTDRDGRLDPAALNRLRFSLSGPNADFDFYEQEDALGKMVPFGNDWAFTFATRVPGNATGSWTIGVEGRISGVELTEDLSINDQMQNVTMPFSVDGSAVAARRDIVDDSTCEGCHSNLSLHGENRHDADAYCQTCHMPGATDEAVRLEGNDESIHFKYMVHKIHMGAELENGYVVYGYRSSIHDYSDVHYPGDLRNCEGCHNEGTYNLPIAEGALPTFSPNTVINPMLPETAACLSCHDSDVAAIHADSNTGGLGEACSVCHGEGKTYSVERVHAR